MTKSIARLGIVLGALATLFTGGTADAQGPAGVTAAVNPQANGTPPTQPSHLLEVGGNVVQNERITTGPEGLTQLLFRDGTTLTVGPDGDMTIDEYVYNPETKTGKLAMSAAIGAFRLVGGRISKTDEVVIKTPVGTVGIRGGVVGGDVGKGFFQVLFGAGRFTPINGLPIPIPANFVAIVTGGVVTIQRATAEQSRQFFASLQARPGASQGNTPVNPEPQGVAQNNSVFSPVFFAPPPPPVFNNLNTYVSYGTQLVTNSSQESTSSLVAGGGTFPTNLPNYSLAFVGPTGPGMVSDSAFSTDPALTITSTSSFTNTSPPQTTTTTTSFTQSNSLGATFDGAGGLSSFSGSSSQSGSTTITCTGTSCPGPQSFSFSGSSSFQAVFSNTTVTGLGGDGLIRFGVVNGGQLTVSNTQSFSGSPSTSSTTTLANTSFPFVIGVPATNLPVQQGPFNYTLIGATPPLFAGGGTPAGSTFTGQLSILFTSASQISPGIPAGLPGIVAGLSGTVMMPGDATYSFQTLGGIANPGAQLGASGNTFTGIGGSSFFGFVAFTGPNAGKACAGSACGVSLSGILAGVGGTRAGISYVIGNFTTGFGANSIIGVAAFKRS